MKELILIKEAKNGGMKFDQKYFQGNQEIWSQISERYISEQIFCRMIAFQNAYRWLLNTL